jgi:phage tail sheath protein FI
MAQVTYPGVYVEEVPSGVRPIAAASTSIAAFIGIREALHILPASPQGH